MLKDAFLGSNIEVTRVLCLETCEMVNSGFLRLSSRYDNSVDANCSDTLF